jgi:transcriptional regulator with XRE-family HTH domain
MKLSDLRSAAEIHEQDMRQDPEYRAEHERTKLANDVAIRVIAYRTEHGLSQADLARKLAMQQPNIARLETGDHEPSLSTLMRLSSVLGIDFSIDIKAGGVRLRQPLRIRETRRDACGRGGHLPRGKDARLRQLYLVTAQGWLRIGGTAAQGTPTRSRG